MQKNIFNVYVAMDSQETCDRMKAVCLENRLKIPYYHNAFTYFNSMYFMYMSDGFSVDSFNGKPKKGYTQVTEAEFLELLKEYKDGTQVHD